MLDPGLLRDDPDRLRRSQRRRGLDDDISGLIALDQKRRQLRRQAEELRAEQRALGQQIARLSGEEKQRRIAEAARVAGQYHQAVAEAADLDAAFDADWAMVPNLVDDSAAEGVTEDDAIELRRHGEIPEFDFPVLDHQEIGEALDVIDMERGVRVSGSRFAYLKGAVVLLELGLVRWAMDRLIAQGFVPVVPPVLVREHAMFGTGFFPRARDQVYAVEADELFLVGTAEVPMAAMHGDEIIDPEALPLRYAGFSTCFRREAGTYGKDTRGVFRVHQFDKVEMFSFTRPEVSWEEHERLLAIQESLLNELELPYRVVNLPAGDLGPSSAKTYDLEAWLPSEGRYRELTSCSNTTDYQARRLRIRARSERGTTPIHTLNGTAVAVSRTLVALLENFQQPDGSVTIPAALRPYAGLERISTEF